MRKYTCVSLFFCQKFLKAAGRQSVNHTLEVLCFWLHSWGFNDRQMAIVSLNCMVINAQVSGVEDEKHEFEPQILARIFGDMD